MNKNKIIYIILGFIFSVIIINLYIHKDTSLVHGDKSFYVGSNTCKECHNKKHKAWSHSSHPKIFKKYTDDSQIIADFENKPDFVKFDKKDIELIIGYQWEQVFAREIDGEYYPFPAKWMELTKKWIPYKTDTWHKTPLTQKCNGCHTTGLNKETGVFVEFGVSCESCHGPGSRHVQNKKIINNFECNVCHGVGSLKAELDRIENEEDIVRTVKSSVCGQCHSRGVENKVMTHQTEVQFNFPVEYMPGEELSKNFKTTTPQTDQKGKNWWGNGVSKNRHQEYADFSKSGHAKSLTNLKIKRSEFCEDKPKDSCLNCHSADYITQKRYKETKPHKKDIVLPTLQTSREGITCVVCHNPHKVGDKKVKAADMCVECHTDETETMKNNPDHYPCPTKEVKCVDCHMPKIVKTGGEFSLRSHAFKIIPPQATEKYGMPSSCQNGSCHQDRSTKWAIDEYNKFYDKKEQTLFQTVKEMK